MLDKDNVKARLIAYYLPQYHPIPENDAWWGKGFTEWTNVAKAKPLFHGHYQPRLPSELGYYDLRVPETREAQAELAQEHGIEGFCYWHYWFSGRLLLERPFEEVLKSGRPNFPFCLGWAATPWTGGWVGSHNEILIRPEFSVEDHIQHFNYLLKAFCDNRYITIDEKPLLYIHYPDTIPNANQMTDLWRELAIKAGFKGMYLVGGGISATMSKEFGFDAYNFHFPNYEWTKLATRGPSSIGLINRLFSLYRRKISKPTICNYLDTLNAFRENYTVADDYFPLILAGWDNTARYGWRGVVLENYTPDNFRSHVRSILENNNHKPFEKNIIFLKSWNEWAEGNYLEPDQRYGRVFLEVLKDELVQDRQQ